MIKLLILFLISLILIELIIRISNFIKFKYFIDQVSRKDFLNKNYHSYLNWYESWKNPMFFYLPIGFRLHNINNPKLPFQVQNNSYGFRCDEFSLENDINTLKVVLLGGSAAWGSGSTNNEKTIAGYLERIINHDKKLLGMKYDKAKVYNLAQVNGTQTQDILTINFFFNKINPDIVVSFTGWNEIAVSDQFDQYILDKFRVFYLDELAFWESSKIEGKKIRIIKEYAFELILENLKIANILFRKFNIRSSAKRNNNEKIENRIKLASNIFLEHLEQINKLSLAHNFKHFQFLQPHLYRKNKLQKDEKNIVDLYDLIRPVHGGIKYGEYLRKNDIYKYVMNKALEDNEKYGSVYNFIDIFKNDINSNFFTLVHLKDSSYEIIAQNMYKLILSSEEKK